MANQKFLIGFYSVRDLLGVTCAIGNNPAEKAEKDWLMEARIACNQAVHDFALQRIDEETFLDRIENTQSIDMDTYLSVVSEALAETEEILCGLTR